jgi:hypothetical protein
MKKLLLYTALILATISLDHFLMGLHGNLWNASFEACKAELIAQNNWQSVDQGADCANHRTVLIRVLGTLLWSEGSYL